MARITTGLSKSFKVPGCPWKTHWQPAFHESFVGHPQSFIHLANLEFVGSSRPMILFASKSDKKNWATCVIKGWGVCTIYITSYPKWAAEMAKWPMSTRTGMLFHEAGHGLANTWNQDISLPPHLWFIQLLQGHWGMPVTGDIPTRTKGTRGVATPEKPITVVLPVADGITWM